TLPSFGYRRWRQYTPLCSLLPFNFRECGGCIARIVVVEQLPSRSLGSRSGIGGCRDGLAAGNEGADVGRQRFEIAALVGECRRPVAHRSVTGNHALRGEAAELADHAEPATNTAVQHGRVDKEHKIAREQCPGLLIEYREIVIGMSGRPGLQ